MCFILAHRQTQSALREVLEGDEGGDLGGARVAISRINFESDEEIDKAETMLAGMDQSMVQDVKVEQCVEVVLESERRFIMHLLDQGVLQDKEGHHLLEAVREDRSASRRAAQGHRIQSGVPSGRPKLESVEMMSGQCGYDEWIGEASQPLERIVSGQMSPMASSQIRSFPADLPRSSGSGATSSDITVEPSPSEPPIFPFTLAQSRKSTSSNLSNESLMGVSSSGPWTKLSSRGAAIRSSTVSAMSMTATPSWGQVPPRSSNSNGTRSPSPKSMLGEREGD